MMIKNFLKNLKLEGRCVAKCTVCGCEEDVLMISDALALCVKHFDGYGIERIREAMETQVKRDNYMKRWLGILNVGMAVFNVANFSNNLYRAFIGQYTSQLSVALVMIITTLSVAAGFFAHVAYWSFLQSNKKYEASREKANRSLLEFLESSQNGRGGA